MSSNRQKSVFLDGDGVINKEVDVGATNAAGINKTILVKSEHSVDEVNSKAGFILKSIKNSTQIIKNNL